MNTAKSPSLLERGLGLFAEVKAGEGVAVILMFLNVLLIMTTYYVLKVVREALAVGGIELFGLDGDEMKTYLSGVMAFLLLGIVPAYGALGSRYDRIGLIKRTTAVVVAGLVGFFIWGSATGVGTAIGISFFVFLGIINVFLIAQFWSYANDIYSKEQGNRLFAIIAIGQSLGAVVGPLIGGLGQDHKFVLLGLSGATFGLCLFLYITVNRLVAKSAVKDKSKEEDEPLKKDGGFTLVFKTRYLLYIALMILCTNVVNTTGEYILSNAAKTNAEEVVTISSVVDTLYRKHNGTYVSEEEEPGWFDWFFALFESDEEEAEEEEEPIPEEWASWFDARSDTEIRAAIDAGEWDLSKEMMQPVKDERSSEIGRFYGDFFFYVNIVGLILQMFFVSRIFKYFGVRAALFVLPVIAFLGYAAIGIIGGLLVLRIAKTLENATDYSLQNTVKQALFLPTSREAKYKAKAAIDTFFVRFGDAASAGIVALGLHVLNFTATAFAFVNVGLCAVWILLNVGIAREHKKLVPDDKGEQKK